MPTQLTHKSCAEWCAYYGTDECPYKERLWHCENFKMRNDHWLWWEKGGDNGLDNRSRPRRHTS